MSKLKQGLHILDNGNYYQGIKKLNKSAIVNSEMVFAICTLLKEKIGQNYKIESISSLQNIFDKNKKNYLIDALLDYNYLMKKKFQTNFLLKKNCKKKKKKGSLFTMIAPYEADSQLAFLNKNGYINLVISNDTDLILYGSKSILFSMDKNLKGKLYNNRKLCKTSFYH